ncbi:MAG TPA: phosphatase PAP2 family protein [Thermomicrobiales bacterium]|nr:phosphatase PAP2 family protein [Thermomicrobiales bacterium]
MSDVPGIEPLFFLFSIDWNPLNWQSWPFIVIIVAALAVRFFLPPVTTSKQALLAEITLLLPAGLLYFLVRGLVDARADEAIANAWQVIDFERAVGISLEPEMQKALLRSETLETAVNWIYIWMHWPVVIGTMIWLIARRPHERYRVYRNAFLLSGAIGMCIFAIHPVAPPRLVPGLGLEDTVTLHSHSYRVLQPPALTNPYAAMPSLHFGWNLLFGIALVRESRKRLVRGFGFVMPLLMYIAIVLTANHYVVDGLVGGVLTATCLLVALKIPAETGQWLTWHGLRERWRL